MREEIKRRGSQKDVLVNRIIEMEWQMFDKVHNAGGRAGCQDDEWTFYVMRYSQHSALSGETLESYLQDLQQAQAEGRNLLTEKYAYMMEFTEPDYFDRNLKAFLPSVSPRKEELVDRIANILIRYQQEFERVYPVFGSKGRPLTGNGGGDVSFHIYTIGELKTYSEQTLENYLKDVQQSCTGTENIAFTIHRTTAGFYGYKSLEEAEAKLADRQR